MAYRGDHPPAETLFLSLVMRSFPYPPLTKVNVMMMMMMIVEVGVISLMYVHLG